MELNKSYWNERYLTKDTGWDLNGVSPALIAMFEPLDRGVKMLIPGAGNAHEAEWLHKNGFKNVYLLDIAEAPIEAFKLRCPDFPVENILCEDFFLHEGEYDLIVEQTFFCALPPEMRSEYVKKMSQLLSPQGVLAGLLFASHFEKEGPPFGGTLEEYQNLFLDYFVVNELTLTELSVKPRLGNELFFVFNNKKN